MDIEFYFECDHCHQAFPLSELNRVDRQSLCDTCAETADDDVQYQDS